METIDSKGVSLRKARKERKISQRELAEMLGVDERTIRNWENGKPIPSTKMTAVDEFISKEPMKSYTEGIPYYNVDFEMGFDLMVNDQTSRPEYKINFMPYNNKCDAWCNARGNSMYPTIASGDIIALKEVKDFSFLISDEIYAIVTSNGLRTIKRLRDAGDDFLLIPDNKKDFSEQRVNKHLITKVYQVMGCMKMF